MNSYIKPVQYGFMSHWSRSTVWQLFLHNILNSCQTDAISKAFDTISHSHLLDKLASVDIVDCLWLWFRAYLASTYNHYSQFLAT